MGLSAPLVVGPRTSAADLPELAVAAALGTLAAELGADVEELAEGARGLHLVLDVGADDAGGVFRAEGEGLGLFALGAGAVVPTVHLFRDDVGLFADAADKEFGGLEDGGADLTEAVAGEDGTGGSFNAIPEFGFRREKVASAADRFDDRHIPSVYRSGGSAAGAA